MFGVSKRLFFGWYFIQTYFFVDAVKTVIWSLLLFAVRLVDVYAFSCDRKAVVLCLQRHCVKRFHTERRRLLPVVTVGDDQVLGVSARRDSAVLRDPPTRHSGLAARHTVQSASTVAVADSVQPTPTNCDNISQVSLTAQCLLRPIYKIHECIFFCLFRVSF